MPDARISRTTSRGPAGGAGTSLTSSFRSPRNSTPSMAPPGVGAVIPLPGMSGFPRLSGLWPRAISRAGGMGMPSKPATADWTIMVFLNAKNNLEPFSFSNFEQMASVGSTERVNVLVEFGRPHHHYSSQFGAWTKTLRFRVTKGMTPTEANALADLGQVNMGDGGTLADFVGWSRETSPARHEMLVIWDHGQGWRLRAATAVRAVERERYLAVRRSLRAEAPAQRGALAGPPDDMRIHGGVRYVS